MPRRDTNSVDAQERAQELGLRALVWVLTEPDRALRFMDLTGLTPAALRAGAGDPAVLSATLAFLESHEPDLMACAAAIDVPPAALVAANESLSA